MWTSLLVWQAKWVLYTASLANMLQMRRNAAPGKTLKLLTEHRITQLSWNWVTSMECCPYWPLAWQWQCQHFLLRLSFAHLHKSNEFCTSYFHENKPYIRWPYRHTYHISGDHVIPSIIYQDNTRQYIIYVIPYQVTTWNINKIWRGL